MEQHIVKIQTLETATYDVLKIRTSKPFFYPFVAGQATEVSINKNGWREKRKPFTFTSLTEDKFLEFFIKIYPTHNDVNLNQGAESSVSYLMARLTIEKNVQEKKPVMMRKEWQLIISVM